MKSQKSPTKITGSGLNTRFGVEDSTRRMRKVAEEELLRPLQVNEQNLFDYFDENINSYHEI